jgi:hypothetical protein
MSVVPHSLSAHSRAVVRVAACLTLVTAAVAAPAAAQGPAAPSASLPAAPVSAAVRGIVVPDGTELAVVTTEDLSSKTATTGDPITLKVNEPVIVNNFVVIPKGAVVKGIVSEAKGAGRMGKGGTLNIRLESTTSVDGQKVPLRAAKGKQGDGKTGTTVALVALFGPIGLLKHGSDANIKAGTELKVFTDAPITVQMP